MVWYTIGKCAKEAYIHGEGRTHKDCLTAFQYNFLITTLDSPELIRVIFQVLLLRIKDVVESHRKGQAHNPLDKNSVEEVDNLLQTGTSLLEPRSPEADRGEVQGLERAAEPKSLLGHGLVVPLLVRDCKVLAGEQFVD